jgi:hypothetical protein
MTKHCTISGRSMQLGAPPELSAFCMSDGTSWLALARQVACCEQTVAEHCALSLQWLAGVSDAPPSARRLSEHMASIQFRGNTAVRNVGCNLELLMRQFALHTANGFVLIARTALQWLQSRQPSSSTMVASSLPLVPAVPPQPSPSPLSGGQQEQQQQRSWLLLEQVLVNSPKGSGPHGVTTIDRCACHNRIHSYPRQTNRRATPTWSFTGFGVESYTARMENIAVSDLLQLS